MRPVINQPSSLLAKQQGLSLIEVLVTILILAIGLLGVAGLQTVSLHNTANIYLQSEVQASAQDLVNRIIANPTAAAAGGYVMNSPISSAPSVDCNSSACSSSQMASYDLYEWSQSLASQPADLPNVDASVSFSTTNNEYGIAITWQAQPGSSYTASNCSSGADNTNPGCLFLAYRLGE